MHAVRRGKFGAFLRSTSTVRAPLDYYENSVASSQKGEICVEIAVGPKGELFFQFANMSIYKFVSD